MARITAAERPRPKTEDLGPKVLAHQRYYSADGELLPGVTTIVRVLGFNTDVLVKWANREGLEGREAGKIKDETAAIGTLAHHLVECLLADKEPDVSDYSDNQIQRASYALRGFHDWRREHDLEPRLVEAQLVSERFKFGGTIDCYAEIDGSAYDKNGNALNGIPTLLDFKTAKGICLEHKIQVAAYWKLLQENGHDVRGVRILRIPRVDGEEFEEHVLTGETVLRCWKVFRRALEIYRLHRELTRGGY